MYVSFFLSFVWGKLSRVLFEALLFVRTTLLLHFEGRRRIFVGTTSRGFWLLMEDGARGVVVTCLSKHLSLSLPAWRPFSGTPSTF